MERNGEAQEMITEDGFLIAMAIVAIFILILIVANLCEKQERELKRSDFQSIATSTEDKDR